ncbi:DUF1190 domain-containing protein [Brevundimonas sp. VNH65]|uniref:DUF1190 domain-containing protein n=1 Tax=Brevundimonas sp. VNH65 TaxID=3400917 RepID=UPI003C0F695D
MSETLNTDDAPAPVMRRLKRSRSLHVSSLMATAAFTLSACDGPSPPPAPVEAAQPVLAYTSLEACKTADEVPDTTCDTAFASAQTEASTTSPRYATRELCEQTWGPGQCNTGTGSDGGSFFTPLMAGFIVGQLLNGGGYRGGGPMYRDRDDRYVNGGAGGGYIGRDWRTGQTTLSRRNEGVVREAPARVQSRTTVVSRGGFGGGGRGYGG